MRVLFLKSVLYRLVADVSGREILDNTCECVIVSGWGQKIGEFAYMKSELRAKSVLGDITVCFKHRLEQLLESTPRVLFQPWPGGMAGGANAVKTRFITTLLNSFAFGSGGLGE